MSTALYRHFDANDVLLYVGISNYPFARLSEHERRSHWSSNIARVTMERFPTRAEAVAAEVKAISTERPLHNVMRREEWTGREVSAFSGGAEVAKKLTTGNLKALLKKGARGTHSDGGSLYLHVRGPGQGYWIYQYRDGAKLNSKSLGPVSIVSLKDARDLRDAFKAHRRALPMSA